MRFIYSIKFRFTIWYLVVLGIALASLSAGAYNYLSRTLYQNLDGALELRAAQISDIREVLMSVAEGQFKEELGEVVYFYFYSGDHLMYLAPRDIDGPVDAELVEQAIAGESNFATVETPEGNELRVLAIPFSPRGPAMVPAVPGTPGSASQGVNIESAALVIGRPTEDIEQALERLRHALMIAVPLTLLEGAQHRRARPEPAA